MKTSLVITDAELTEQGILIKSISVIDKLSGEHLRAGKLSQELIKYFMACEFDTDKFMEVIRLAEMNPNLKKIISEYNCQIF